MFPDTGDEGVEDNQSQANQIPVIQPSTIGQSEYENQQFIVPDYEPK